MNDRPETFPWKILMVDDDEEDYLIVRCMLAETQQGKCILERVDSYEAGLAAIRKDQYDAVLVDYDLGPRRGIELIRQATAQGYPGAFILYTGRGSYQVDLEATQAGASLYLTKGETSALLLERGIRYAIERKQNEQALARANALLFKQKQELDRRLREQTRLAFFPQFNPNPVLEIDLTGYIRYMNPSSKKLFPDLPEQGPQHAFLTGWEKVVAQLSKDPRAYLVREVQVGKQYYQQSVYFYQEYQIIRCYGMDISPRRRAELALEAAQARILQEINGLD